MLEDAAFNVFILKKKKKIKTLFNWLVSFIKFYAVSFCDILLL